MKLSYCQSQSLRVRVAPKPVNLPASTTLEPPVKLTLLTKDIKCEESGFLPSFDERISGSSYFQGIVGARSRVLSGLSPGPIPSIPFECSPAVTKVHFQRPSWLKKAFDYDSDYPFLDPDHVVVFGREVRVYIPAFKEGTTMSGASANLSTCELFRLPDWVKLNSLLDKKGLAFWDTMSLYTIKAWCRKSETPAAFYSWKNFAAKANRMEGAARTKAMKSADRILLRLFYYTDKRGERLDARYVGKERKSKASGRQSIFSHGAWCYSAVVGDSSAKHSKKILGGDVSPCYSSTGLLQRCAAIDLFDVPGLVISVDGYPKRGGSSTVVDTLTFTLVDDPTATRLVYALAVFVSKIVCLQNSHSSAFESYRGGRAPWYVLFRFLELQYLPGTDDCVLRFWFFGRSEINSLKAFRSHVSQTFGHFEPKVSRSVTSLPTIKPKIDHAPADIRRIHGTFAFKDRVFSKYNSFYDQSWTIFSPARKKDVPVFPRVGDEIVEQSLFFEFSVDKAKIRVSRKSGSPATLAHISATLVREGHLPLSPGECASVTRMLENNPSCELASSVAFIVSMREKRGWSGSVTSTAIFSACIELKVFSLLPDVAPHLVQLESDRLVFLKDGRSTQLLREWSGVPPLSSVVALTELELKVFARLASSDIAEISHFASSRLASDTQVLHSIKSAERERAAEASAERRRDARPGFLTRRHESFWVPQVDMKKEMRKTWTASSPEHDAVITRMLEEITHSVDNIPGFKKRLHSKRGFSLPAKTVKRYKNLIIPIDGSDHWYTVRTTFKALARAFARGSSPYLKAYAMFGLLPTNSEGRVKAVHHTESADGVSHHSLQRMMAADQITTSARKLASTSVVVSLPDSAVTHIPRRRQFIDDAPLSKSYVTMRSGLLPTAHFFGSKA
jgi:hypothetical protein